MEPDSEITAASSVAEAVATKENENDNVNAEEKLKEEAKTSSHAESDGITEVASQIDTAKLKAMRAKLAGMSSEEMKEKVARMKAMMSNMTPEQLAKMKSIAKAKLQATEAKVTTIKATDVAVGLEGQFAPVTLEANPAAIFPTGKAIGGGPDVDTKGLSGKELYDLVQGKENSAKQKILSDITPEQTKELNAYVLKKDPELTLLTMVVKGNLQLCKAAIEHGADVNHADKRGDTVFMLACWNGKRDIVDYLLEQKADIHRKNDCDQTALHYACMKGNIKLIQLLMKHGADMELRDNKGYTAVFCAAQFGATAILDFLKRKGANLFGRDNEQHTILHWTAYNKHPLATSWILNEGIDIHAKDSKGRTAVHWAAKQGNSGILELLVEFIDEEGFHDLLQLKDNEERTPLDLAKYYENTKATKYITEVLRRQHGCMAFWNRLTCQQGIRPGAEMKKTSMMVSGWLIVVMAISFCHFWFVVRPYSPTVPDYCSITMIVLTALCYVLWMACNCVDPGYIPPKVGSSTYRKTKGGGGDKKGQHERLTETKAGTEMQVLDECEAGADQKKMGEVDLEQGENGKETPSWAMSYEALLQKGRFDAICVTCGIVKPLRSKHCKHCGRCVSRFDHHCPWIDNCVAENNRKQFVGLAVVQTVSTWFYVVMVGMHLETHTCSDALAFTLGLPLLLHGAVVGSWGLMLAFEHVSLMLTNITTNEKMNQFRYSYMRTEDGAPTNPFDEGKLLNLLYFCGCRSARPWQELDITTKFLPPGGKGCCSNGHGHGHGGGGGHGHSKGCDKEGADRKEEKALLQGSTKNTVDQVDAELGAGVGL